MRAWFGRSRGMPKPMVLGYLTNHYGRASDTFIRQEVRQLRKLGHTVFTFSIRRPGREHAVSDEVRTEQAKTDYILEAGPLNLGLAVLVCTMRHPLRMARTVALAWKTCAPGLRTFVWQVFYLVEASYLARRIESLGVEHVHNHIAMNSASVCMLAAVLSGVTWSMTVHGPHDLIEPLRWALPEKLESSAFSVFIAEFGRSQGMWHVPPSVWPKLHVVRCGLDETFLRSAPISIPQTPRLVCVGRLSPEKGVVLLVEAAAKLKRDGVRVELVLIGDGPSRPDIEQSVARHGLAEAVTLAGWLGSERVREEILGSRAVVSASFAEGLPIVLMEALALHRPVVSTYVAGIPELVQPGINGFLVPPGSVDDLAEAMRAVVGAPIDQLAEMGRRGAARVADRHDAAANARQLEALLWKAVNSRRRESATRGSLTAPVDPL
jgi:colanic acid/amylovoran biosynthesis glycosyltransferase